MKAIIDIEFRRYRSNPRGPIAIIYPQFDDGRVTCYDGEGHSENDLGVIRRITLKADKRESDIKQLILALKDRGYEVED